MALPGPGDRGEKATSWKKRKKLRKKKKARAKKSQWRSTTRRVQRVNTTHRTAKKNRKARKKRARKSLARSTARRVQRHNKTRTAMRKARKKKQAKKKKTIRKSTSRPLPSGRSYSKGRVVRRSPGKSTFKKTGGKVRKAKGGGKKGGKKKKGKKKKGGMKYPGSLNQKSLNKLQGRAALLAKEQYKPALDSINQQLRVIRRERDRDVGVQTAFGEKGDERLGAAAEWLDQVLSRQAGTVKDIYGAASQNIEGAYAGAGATQQAAGDKVLSQMRGSAAQLGLNEALETPESELKAEILSAQAETEGDAANSMANIETLGAQEQARAQDTVSAAARQSTQDRANLQTEVAGGIASVQRQAAEQLAEGHYAKRDITNQRALSTKTTAMQLRQEERERQRQKYMDKLYASVQKNTMRLQNAQLNMERTASKFNRKQTRKATNLSQQQFRFNKQLALRQLRNEEAALRAEIAAANSPAARQQYRLELEKVRADINYTNARTAAQLAKATKWRSNKAKNRSRSWSKPLPGPGERPGGR